MGICEVCREETTQKVYSGEKKKPVYRCDECNWIIINKYKKEYMGKYKKAIKKMKETHYISISSCLSEEELPRIFEAYPEHMACVDIIRDIMKKKGFQEEYYGCQMEVVDSLYYEKVSDEKTFCGVPDEAEGMYFYIEIKEKLPGVLTETPHG